MFCAFQLSVSLLRPLPPIFPQKWLRLQKLQFFMSQSTLPSLEEDNNIYNFIYIIIYYYYLQSESTPKVLVPPPLKTVTSVTVTTVTISIRSYCQTLHFDCQLKR